MTFAPRHLCLAILIAFLIGHVGIAVHAATHVSGDSGDCELCISYGDATHVVAAGHEQVLENTQYRHALVDLNALPDTLPEAPYHPRGPPLSI
ncbi:MAG: hypothetical protein OER91_10565 [Gammaproteobacteria bacterium]|nr:hypothetical protein [Gammaproteobacteria bacterium]